MILNDNSIIFHIDVNSAYLSWSALRELQNGSKLDLRTIPSIVGGDQETRHGIVVAKSIPAKAFGIQTAETVCQCISKMSDNCDGSSGSHLLPGNEPETDASPA